MGFLGVPWGSGVLVTGEGTDLTEIAARRIQELLRLDLAEIRNLPDFIEEEISLGTNIRVGRYHTVSQSGEHTVVVQVAREHLAGMVSTVVVEGFVVSPDSTIRALTEQEKWPYQ